MPDLVVTGPQPFAILMLSTRLELWWESEQRPVAPEVLSRGSASDTVSGRELLLLGHAFGFRSTAVLQQPPAYTTPVSP